LATTPLDYTGGFTALAPPHGFWVMLQTLEQLYMIRMGSSHRAFANYTLLICPSSITVPGQCKTCRWAKVSGGWGMSASWMTQLSKLSFEHCVFPHIYHWRQLWEGSELPKIVCLFLYVSISSKEFAMGCWL